MAFPTSTDSFSNPQGTTQVSSDDHALQHRTEGSAIVAIENKVGLSAGTPTLGKILQGSGNGTSTWSQTWNGGTLGTAVINNSTLGTNQITGGTITSLIGTSNIVGGTLSGVIGGAGTVNGITLGTPVIGTIALSGTTTPLSIGGGLTNNLPSIADAPGGTITVNAAAGNYFIIQFGTTVGNRTIGTPANLTNGQVITYAVKNNTTSNGTIIWSPIYKWAGGTAGTASIGTTASCWNLFSFRYASGDSSLLSAGYNTNIS